jgi:hypothetical protein
VETEPEPKEIFTAPHHCRELHSNLEAPVTIKIGNGIKKFLDNEQNSSLKSSTSAKNVGTAVTENAELRGAQQPVSCVLEL